MKKTNQWGETAMSLIHLATLAPSSHNTQPWLFRVSGKEIELLADRNRSLPINDPGDRELTISCGCALYNLRLAAIAKGLNPYVVLLPDGEQSNVLARVRFELNRDVHPKVESLLVSIRERRTYRKKFLPDPPDSAAIIQLQKAAQQEGAMLCSISEPSLRHHVAGLVKEGDALQWANPYWRAELAAWMLPQSHGEGLSVPSLVAPLIRMFVQMLDMGRSIGESDRKLALNSPHLSVLTTDGDTSCQWLQAGQALQNVLLLACSYGLQAGFLNQPVQIASLRQRLQSRLNCGTPQILLRLGYPARSQPQTPRRPVSAIIDWA